jgi:hypothetical protein
MSLYVGGFFDSIDGVESRGIARLDDYANVSVPANASSMTDLEMEIAPNPSASEQSLRFRLPSAARCRVFIMDLQGREVARLLDAWAPAGPQRMKWDGRTNAGGKAGAGVYWAVVRSGGVHASRQLIRIR